MVSVVICPKDAREENEWDYVLSNLSVDTVYILGGYQGTNNILRDAPTIESLEDLPKGEIVLMLPKTARYFEPTISLVDFKHPEDAIYVFGANNEHFSKEDAGSREIDNIVYIPTDSIDEMYNYTAYIITMWSRRYG